MHGKVLALTKPVDTGASFRQQTAANIDRHSLFSIFAVVAIAIVFAGFARTFFLRFLFASPRMAGYLYVHGLLFSSSFVLFSFNLVWSHLTGYIYIGVLACSQLELPF